MKLNTLINDYHVCLEKQGSYIFHSSVNENDRIVIPKTELSPDWC